MKETTAFAFDKDKGFSQLLECSAARYPEKTAIIFQERRLSYRELNGRVKRLAEALRLMRLEPGKNVAILMPNCPEFLEIMFACAKIGITVVKINWRLSPREIIKMLEFNDVGFLFLRMRNSDWKLELLAALEDFAYLDMDSDDYEKLTAFAAEISDPPHIPGDTVLMHLHTSGTLGTPKCVMYTHGGMLAQIETCIKSINFSTDMIFQFVAQLFHIVSIGAYMCIAVGGTIVLLNRFDPASYLESIEKNRVSRLSVVPTMVEILLSCPDFDKYDLSSLREIGYGTAPMPPSLLGRLLKKVNCDYYQSYGMTEMASIVTVLDSRDHADISRAHLYSVGKPMDGCAVKIADDNGNACPAGVTGEILLSGPGMMKGYYKAPEATREAIRDGWYHTQDMGCLSEDGYLFLRGRKNDMIISGGENIYPREVEDVIMEMGDVLECAAFGIPDTLWGEQVCACVVLHSGSAVTEEDILRHCAGKIANYKLPKNVHIVGDLPKNALGKVKRGTLRETYSGLIHQDSTAN